MNKILLLAAIFSASIFTSQASAVEADAADADLLTIVTDKVTAVPEPTAFALVGLAGIAIILRRRK